MKRILVTRIPFPTQRNTNDLRHAGASALGVLIRFPGIPQAIITVSIPPSLEGFLLQYGIHWNGI